MSRKTVKVALVQKPPIFLNLPDSMQKFARIALECAEGGAKIIVFPETWLPGYPVWFDNAPGASLWEHPPVMRLHQYLLRNSISIPGKEIATILDVSQRTGCVIVVGTNERVGGTIYNTTVFAEPGGNFVSHRKLTPTFSERMVWGQGDGSTLNVLETSFGRIGGLICWEHWLPLARAAMHAQDETIHIAQFPTVSARHQVTSQNYAFEGQCWVLASGCCLTKKQVLEGFESLQTSDTEVYDFLESMQKTNLQSGGSAIISPNMKYKTEPVFDDDRTVYGDINLGLVDLGRMLLDANGHYSRPDIFSLSVDTNKRQNVQFGP